MSVAVRRIYNACRLELPRDRCGFDSSDEEGLKLRERSKSSNDSNIIAAFMCEKKEYYYYEEERK